MHIARKFSHLEGVKTLGAHTLPLPPSSTSGSYTRGAAPYEGHSGFNDQTFR